MKVSNQSNSRSDLQLTYDRAVAQGIQFSDAKNLDEIPSGSLPTAAQISGSR